MSDRIGLYGGSFDPIHYGHLIVARAIVEELDLDRMVFLPAASPPHKRGQQLTDAARRAEMVRLAINEEPAFDFSDFDLTRAGPSFTIDTVAHFRGLHGDKACLFWIIGADSLAELTSWHRVGDLVDSCQIVTAARTDCPAVAWDELHPTLNDDQIASLKKGVLKTPIVEISSTQIRRRIREGRSVRYLFPEQVRAYIYEHGLYDASPPPQSGLTFQRNC